jgi:hypothetical protein
MLRLRMRFRREGDVLIGDVEVEPGGGVSKHFHPKLAERWTVIEGDVEFRIGRERQVPAAGGELLVAAGVRHSFKNISSSPARLRFEADPALELEEFLTEAAAMNRAGMFTRFGAPTSVAALLQGARFALRYRDTCVLLFPPPFPPPALQPAVFSPLAKLATRRQAGRA